jgi:hypothetical protein
MWNKTIKLGFCLSILVLMLVFTSVAGMQQNAQGWTVFTPSADTRIFYVSSSEGSDQTARGYSAAEVNPNPMNPSNIAAFATFKAALDSVRNGFPDWILIKRGDTLTEGINLKNGRNPSERFVVATYGSAVANPLFLPGSNTQAISQCCKGFEYIAVQGLDFYAAYRNPDDPAFTTYGGNGGLSVFVGDTHVGHHLLIEGVRLRFFKGSTIQAWGELKDIVIRRSTFLDHYSTDSHCQGLYSANASLTLEENIFDHNGWYQQAQSGVDAPGKATMFNHNTYFVNMNNVTFKGNVFLRSSSIQNKWTANNGIHSTRDILIDDNLYVDGEIAMSIGGNKEGPHRFQNIAVRNNVMLKIGESQPTNRTLGWGIEIKDWDGGEVVNNYFLHQTKLQVNNTYGLNIFGTTSNVRIARNVFYNLHNAYALVVQDGGSKTNLDIESNVFHQFTNARALVHIHSSPAGTKWAKNQYYHANGSTNAFSVNGQSLGYTEWLTESGETNSQWQAGTFPDSTRDLESYLVSIGEAGSFDNYIHLMRSVHMGNWRPELMALSVNKFIRTGFGQESTVQVLNPNLNTLWIPLSSKYDALGRMQK